jgi:uncharacterized RDD family membrane protein YckC
MSDIIHGHPDPQHDAEFYAGIPAKRLLAWLADSVLIGVLVLLALPFTAFLGLLVLPLLWLAVGLAYRIVTLANQSATPGMRLVAIEFRNRYGERFTLAEAATHTVIYTTAMAFFLIQILSIVLILTGAKAQGLPDHAIGSVAINRPAARH